MGVQIKQNDQWVEAKKVWIKVSGVWTEVFDNSGGGQYYIDTPSIIKPTENEVINLLVFQSSEFSGDPRVVPVSSFWEIAKDAAFLEIEKTQQFNWPNDLYNWTLGSFDLPGGVHYVRVKYSGKTYAYDEPVQSLFSSARRFDFQGPLPPFVNGTRTFTPGDSLATWTVPARIYRLRVEMYGANSDGNIKGGYVKAEFDVTPGEVFNFGKGRFYPSDQLVIDSLYFGKNNASTPTTFSPSELWVVAGSAGGPGYRDPGFPNPVQIQVLGGAGGGSQGDSGGKTGSTVDPGGGGSQSSGGGGGSASGTRSNPGRAGGVYLGGPGGRGGTSDLAYQGGYGGTGFYGGGGGGGAGSGDGYASGGGGSNGINIPSGRNVSNAVSEKGTSDGNRRVILTW